MRFREQLAPLAVLVLTALLLAVYSWPVHAAPAGGPRFANTVGVNTHLGGARETLDPTLLQRLAAAGVTFIRNDLTWAAVEQTAGVYDFSTTGYDDLVEAAEANGLTVLLILDYGNSLYGPAQAVLSDAGRSAFAAFATAAAQRYGGRGHRWEIWNEPNLPQFWSGDGEGPDPAQYARLVDAAVPALRAADPQATILAGATFMGLPTVVPAIGGVEGLDFLGRLFTTGVLALVDGITVHSYRAEPPETVAMTVDSVRQLMSAAGRTVPLWSGEWGYSTYDPSAPPTGVNYIPAVTPEQQASYAVRMALTNYELGLAGTVWYDDRDAATPSPGNIEDHFGLMQFDLTPKPAYQALATLLHLVGASSGSSLPPPESGDHVLEFATDAGPVTALWSAGTALWRVEGHSPTARILARDGSDMTPARLAQGLQLRVSADDGPIYLVGDIAVLAPSHCAGDCDGDARVTIDELITAVDVSLDRAALVSCAVADTDADGAVSVAELVTAVQNALDGCA
jgi:hypothetical protein